MDNPERQEGSATFYDENSMALHEERMKTLGAGGGIQSLQFNMQAPVRFCPNCGTERKDGYRFCPECGSKFE